jgi:hypothetical protein
MENAYCSHCKKIVFVEPVIDDDELITTGYMWAAGMGG